MDEPRPDERTQEALEMAIVQRRPPDELVPHADPGSHYTSDEYQALLAKHPLLARFSGLGGCYATAPMARCGATLKTDRVYRQHYPTRADATTAILAYIQGWSNPRRRHSTPR